MDGHVARTRDEDGFAELTELVLVLEAPPAFELPHTPTVLTLFISSFDGTIRKHEHPLKQPNESTARAYAAEVTGRQVSCDMVVYVDGQPVATYRDGLEVGAATILDGECVPA